MGLVAFLVSRILQVPLVTSFHTDVPRCVGRLTGDKLNEEAAWTDTRWFYHRSDLTFVPSVYTSRDLAAHGLDHHKMAVLYQGVDTSGQVILEAQASGLPVVLCYEGGACENIEPGVSGLTAPSRNLAEFTRQIELLLDDKETYAAMAKEARKLATGRSWERCFENLFDTYTELVSWWQPLSIARPVSTEDYDAKNDLPLDFFLRLSNSAASSH